MSGDTCPERTRTLHRRHDGHSWRTEVVEPCPNEWPCPMHYRKTVRRFRAMSTPALLTDPIGAAMLLAVAEGIGAWAVNR